MGSKIIVLEACAIGLGTHVEPGEKFEATREDAATLVRSGRAMYLDKADDPTKGLHTASADDVKRATDAGKARAAEAKAKAEEVDPQVKLAAMIASAVRDALAAKPAA
jgi:hypothetical protein